MTARYAIYFVPERHSELYRFGASVLGYDCYSGHTIEPPSDAPPDWQAVVGEPRRYGFHATFKAPFRLRDGLTEAALRREFDEVARWQFVIDAGGLVVRSLGSFIALVPKTNCQPLNNLAAECVRGFERYRAPLTTADRGRRLAACLSPRQIERLDRWGYPFVFEDFRFHMTLTGPLDEPERGRALSYLRRKFEMLPRAHSLLVGQIVLVKQDGTAPFKVLQSAPLGNSPYLPFACSF